MDTIKIAIAEDHETLRKALINVLDREESIHIVLAVEHGKELIDQLVNTPTDVVLLDVQMPVMNGMETLIYLKKHYPDLRVVMFSTNSALHLIEWCRKNGADAYVCKGSTAKQLLKAIRDNGEFHLYDW